MKYALAQRSTDLALEAISYYKWLTTDKKEYIMAKQLLRSATSIGANIREAYYAVSRPDFVNKMQIALKECYETDYWLAILKDTDNLTEDHYKLLFIQCSKIRKLLTASIKTAKSNE